MCMLDYYGFGWIIGANGTFQFKPAMKENHITTPPFYSFYSTFKKKDLIIVEVGLLKGWEGRAGMKDGWGKGLCGEVRRGEGRQRGSMVGRGRGKYGGKE